MNLPLSMPVDESTIELKIEALKIKQPIGDFFLARLSYSDLIKISYFDVRRVLKDERDVEKYLGIQRPLNPKRVEQLEKYVNYIDATFPSSIILAVDGDYASYDEVTKELTLRNFQEGEASASIAIRSIARVLDGQHRIAGLYKLPDNKAFDLAVTIFVGSDQADQAYIFSTVNLEQTKVSKSLAYDLFELARTRSPQKTAHNVAVALDRNANSPFYRRIKRLGFANDASVFQTLTQATFVEAILKLISREPKTDRDNILRGVPLAFDESDIKGGRVLRPLFVKDDDIRIALIIDNYFSAVRDRWQEGWDFRGQGRVLNKASGFKALMRVFPKAYSYFAKPGDLVTRQKFSELFARVKVDDDFFNVEQFKPGSSGEKDLSEFFDRAMFQ